MPVDVTARVIDNTRLSDTYNVLGLAAPPIAASVAAGQFVMVRATAAHDPLLRRPFSVFEVIRGKDADPIGISLLSKRIGVTTGLLYDARPGDEIALLGPLGRPFAPIDPPVHAWMIAGGVGLAPFACLAESLRIRGVHMTLFYGARAGSELFYLDFFRRLGVELVLTTEDGSKGERGSVVRPLERRLADCPSNLNLMMYACGPERMLAAVAKIAERFNRPCQVSVERVMGCGVGGCYSCVVPTRDPSGGVHHVRSCLEGPVLLASQIAWD